MTTRTILGRRSLLLGLGAAAAALPLSACVGSGGGTSTEPEAVDTGEITGKIEFWTINLRKNFQAYFDDLIAKFEAAHEGVEISWVDVPGADMTAKYLSAVASGKVPDVVNVDSKNLGQLDNTLGDLGPYFDDKALAAYQPGLVQGLRVKESLKGIPWYNSGTLVGIYRKSIMDKISWGPEQAPKTWQEAIELAVKVRQETKVYGANIDPGCRRLQAMGVQFVNDDLTQATFNTPEAAEFVSLFQAAYASGGIAPGASAIDGNYPQEIDNGQLAFRPDAGPGALTSLEKNSPETYKDLYVTAAPLNTEGKSQMTGQMALCMPAQSKNKATAKAFLEFVASPESQLAFCELVPIFPSTVETLKAPLFTDNPGKTPSEQARKIVTGSFATTVDTTIPLPAGAGNQIRTEFDAAQKETMRSGGEAKAALDARQKIWQEALDKANGSN